MINTFFLLNTNKKHIVLFIIYCTCVVIVIINNSYILYNIVNLLVAFKFDLLYFLFKHDTLNKENCMFVIKFLILFLGIF